MSAVWVKLTALLCLSCTGLSGPAENSEVLWKHIGESITIQCRCENQPDSLYVKRGLNKNVDIFYKTKESKKNTITNGFKDRLQVNGVFPNLDFLIRNLTFEDTGPYWCLYQTFDEHKTITTDGKGSLLLVVKGSASGSGNEASKETCKLSKENLVLVSVVISAAVLLCIIMGILMWLIKRKMPKTTMKPRRIPNNDVYEDMRGTLRR